MNDDERNLADDLRGASQLVVDGTRGVTNVVRDMHHTIASGPAALGRPLAVPSSLITRLIYGGIRGVTGVVGTTIDQALKQLAPLLSETPPGPARDALIATVNGVVGDYLAETKNPLAIPLQVRARAGEVTRHLLVMVHGSCMSDQQWKWKGHDHGAVLTGALGASRVDVRYNSGLHISTNGEQLATALEELVTTRTVPVEKITVVGFSMGGLVARSAIRVAELEPYLWRDKLRALAFVGTPHHGAPLERGGNWIDVLLGISSYSAPLARLGKIRSAGITDLRYGFTLDEHWHGRDRFAKTADARTPHPLPDGVACFAVAGTLGNGSDGLVPLPSALGASDTAELDLGFDDERTMVIEAGHLDLLGHEGIADQLCGWLA